MAVVVGGVVAGVSGTDRSTRANPMVAPLLSTVVVVWTTRKCLVVYSWPRCYRYDDQILLQARFAFFPMLPTALSLFLSVESNTNKSSALQ